ncbi:hypothetical protein J3L11_12900 [Shewanella sp. 4t3-1-2LB]|uniref:hypothetical protein n=1 Tax=Shewanella sp. 4t3-1-2LB TaxID=2817682 RepID=UPI001A99C23D|nr:hypothetical protein [Shewanella sp. 4t3-1-2LB]MBO1272543.1 hypothetical protein [Shewanella sp. 4t3-1-2LB]
MANTNIFSVKQVLWIVCFLSSNAFAETLTCGLKTVTVAGKSVTKIMHEDGTVSSGSGVSNNWFYDGKSIRHRLLDEIIPCGNKPKSRNEVIEELSGQFVKKPDIYGMNKREAELIKKYTANLMNTNAQCYLLIDAAKSTSRKNSFYIDCHDKSSHKSRIWVSMNELEQGITKQPASPLANRAAIDVCSNALKGKVTNSSTYNPSLLLGSKNITYNATGRNVVDIEFEASNKLGVAGKYNGHCVLEGGKPIEVTIKER